MDPYHAVITLFIIWLGIYFIHKCMKEKFARYEFVLAQLGLGIFLFHIRWQTRQLNGIFHTCTSLLHRRLKAWFTVGVFTSAIGMIFSTAFLCVTLIQNISSKDEIKINSTTSIPVTTSRQITTGKLVPMLPGVNLPLEDIPYYLTSIITCSVFHEMGHAMAAIRERVQVDSFGFILFFAFPGAFVDLHTDHLCLISPFRRLRIFCAGIWHNFILVILMFIVLKSLPWTLHRLYEVNSGVYVNGIHPSSSLYGAGGLVGGDVIKQVDECRVSNVIQWEKCVREAYAGVSSGYCVPLSYISEHEAHKVEVYADTVIPDVTQCCKESDLSSKMCFSYVADAAGGASDAGGSSNTSCLPARAVITSATCYTNTACSRILLPAFPGRRDRTESPAARCVKPLVYNSTKLTRILVEGGSRGKHVVIHLGDPRDIYVTLTIGSFVPKFTFIPQSLPNIVDKFCRYVIAISAALAILNVVPCYALDGQYIISTYMDTAPFRSFTYQTKRNISSCILFFGTVIVISNVLLALKPFGSNIFNNSSIRSAL